MATYQSELAKFGEEGLEPMHPSSQCLNAQLSLCIIGIAESEIPIDVDKIMVPLKSDLLLVSPGFSSVVVRKNGQQWWKRVEVQFEDHVVIPTFPPGLSPESYTKHYDEYFSKISLDKLPETRPLWELHIIKYPTQTAAGTLVFKMHHALGDGFSIMGAIFSMLKRADNPSLPLTFPSATSAPKEIVKENIVKTSLGLVSRCFNTVFDIAHSMMHTAWYGDSPNPIRSGTPSVEYSPMHTTRVILSLDDIRKVQSKIHVSVNDVVVGMIFYGIHLYSKKVGKSLTESQKTALVVLNTRMLNGYRNLDEMLEKNLWGNKFSFIHIPMPTHSDGEKVDLKTFILEARKIIQRNRNSMAVLLNGLLLALMDKFQGSEAVSKYVYTTMNKCSVCVSNLIGPKEKLAIADHPISNIYFTVAGVPMVNILAASY
ncbi:hypothetical protein AQUCO_00700591v1 [Aquilegia coerulea]|uniref:Uncharacterized protein n=1 Tax=Aquilegia coerulea TaxID=218851 RepID=A0A2G5EKS6_AQUCA|nr:hypothetical protein AQUCO_00700591v1 [Aquilegia coerulea]